MKPFAVTGETRVKVINLAKLIVNYQIKGNFIIANMYADELCKLIGRKSKSNLDIITDPNGIQIKIYKVGGSVNKSNSFWKAINRWSKQSSWVWVD